MGYSTPGNTSGGPYAAVVQGKNKLNIDGKYKVRRKVSMNDTAMVWEVAETDFASPIRGADMEDEGRNDVENTAKNSSIGGSVIGFVITDWCFESLSILLCNTSGGPYAAVVQGKNKLNIDGKYKVRRKVSMNDTAMVWEVAETDFASPIRGADMEDEGRNDVENTAKAVSSRKVRSSLHDDIQPKGVHSVAKGVDVGSYEDTNTGSKPNVASGTLEDEGCLADVSKVSFASILLPKVADDNESDMGSFFPKPEKRKIQFRTLINEEKVECVECVLPRAAGNVVKGRYDNSLVGFLLFSSKSGMEQVLKRGPWMICKSPIILNKWSSSFSLKKGDVTEVRVWVKMHNVPGRIGFARALIEVSSDSGLKKEVIMAISNEEGTDYIKEVIKVEYEWKLPHCVACKRFGHGPTTCPNRIKEDVQNAPSMASLMVDHEEVLKPGKNMGDASKLGAKDQKEGSTSQSSIAKTSILEDRNLKNSFEALKDSNNIFEAQESSNQSSMWTDDLESDDEVDEVLFPKGDKFGDQFDIRLKGRVRK
nr:hypothetical protein [Tanacetum cinerariifolium]